MAMNDKLTTMKMNPRAAKQAACRSGRTITPRFDAATFRIVLAWRAESYLEFGSRRERLLLVGDDADVEDSREDEDEAGSRCGSCR